ncbi:MAG: HesA/MoeB/ThiF family protein [Candidatus Hodarchaeales archaeon]
MVDGKKSYNNSRYDRQERVENWDQEKILSSKVILIGAGALGCVAGLNLAAMGIGNIVVIDLDTVETSNLSRQFLFRDEHVGQEKAIVAANGLRKMNPDIKIEGISSRVQDVPLRVFKPINERQQVVLLDGLDNFETRRWVNSLAVNNNLPLVSGGMYGHYGNLQVIIPGHTPCLECQPLIPERVLQKACTRPGQRRQPELDTEEIIPSLASVSSVIGGLMSQEAIKIILNGGNHHENILSEYLFWDGLTQNFVKIPLAKREDCVVCSSKFRLKGIPFTVTKEDTVKDLLDRVVLQFMVENIELVHAAKTLDPSDRKTLAEIMEDSSLVYVNSNDLPGPIKLKLEFLNSSPAEVGKDKE